MKNHHGSFHRWGFLITLILFGPLFFSIASGYGAQLTLAWDANAGNDNDPGQIRYRVYQRQAGQSYDYRNPAWDGGPETTCTLTLPDPTQTTTYYFVARAYYLSDPTVESADSAAIAHTLAVETPPPTANPMLERRYRLAARAHSVLRLRR